MLVQTSVETKNNVDKRIVAQNKIITLYPVTSFGSTKLSICTLLKILKPKKFWIPKTSG